MEFVQIPVRLYYDYLDDHADLRVKNWLGMSSPFPTIALSLAYFVIVKVKLSRQVYSKEYSCQFSICSVKNWFKTKKNITAIDFGLEENFEH